MIILFLLLMVGTLGYELAVWHETGREEGFVRPIAALRRLFVRG